MNFEESSVDLTELSNINEQIDFICSYVKRTQSAHPVIREPQSKPKENK